ncbi:MAG: hypothetical protein IIY07_00585, partial [Thermoguttaceae bacterium]|nr:hypothetical protein [Thermoguttaceae bacterium]
MNDFRSEETRWDDEPSFAARSNAPFASRLNDERRDLDAGFRDGSVAEILSVGDAFDYSDYEDDDALYDEFDDDFDSDDFDDDFDEDFEVLPDDEFNEAIDDEDYPEEEDGGDDADASEFTPDDDFDD